MINYSCVESLNTVIKLHSGVWWRHREEEVRVNLLVSQVFLSPFTPINRGCLWPLTHFQEMVHTLTSERMLGTTSRLKWTGSFHCRWIPFINGGEQVFRQCAYLWERSPRMQPVSWVYCTKPCVVQAVYELKLSGLSWRVGNHAGKISSGRRLITCCDTTGRGQARKVFWWSSDNIP